MKKLLEILNEIRPEIDFENTSDFISDNILDSFDIISLVCDIDEAFSISIDGSDILPENFDSLEAIVSLIEKSGGKI